MSTQWLFYRSLVDYKNEKIHFGLNSTLSIENISNTSVKCNLNKKQEPYGREERQLRMKNTSLKIEKPRERSRRLYNRRDDIYLPDISQKSGAKRGGSMLHL